MMLTRKRCVRASYPFALLLAITGLVGCGPAPEPSESMAISTEQPLIVLMGGNQSCRWDGARNEYTPRGIGMEAHVQDIVDELGASRGVKARILLTCYEKSATIHYTRPSAPQEVGSTDLKGLLGVISEETAGTAPAYVVGHSYGGWLTMQTILGWNAGPLKGVFTIDPISRVECTYTSPFGCTQSPGDVSGAERAIIAERSEWWQNFYQLETWYLHASAIGEADENFEIAAAHTEIDTDEDLWARVGGLIKSQW